MAAPEVRATGRSARRAAPAPWIGAAAAALVVGAAAVIEVVLHQPMWPWVVAAALACTFALAVSAARGRRDRDYRSLMNRVPVGLYRTAPGGRIVDANPALARLLGFETPADLLAAPATSVYVDPSDRARWVAEVDGAHGSVETQLRMRRRDGAVIWVRDRVVPVRDRRGRVRYYEGQLEDVTDEKRHREELEAALRSRIELIGTVSHELRNPLTAIVGYTALLAAAGEGVSPEYADMAAVVGQQAEDMADLVEDLLTAAHSDTGTLRVVSAPLDLAAEVERTVSALQGRHVGTLEVDAAPAPALADAMRVRQIVRNLVVNAIVHGGGRIVVSTRCPGGKAQVVVADDGPGLAPGDEERVFEPFQHGARETRGHTSVGLGLTISRRLARLMGGDLSYHRVGGTTEFRLVLPGRPLPSATADRGFRIAAPVG